MINFSRLYKSPKRLGTSIFRGPAFTPERRPVGDADQGKQGRRGEASVPTPISRRECDQGRQDQRGEHQQGVGMVVAHRSVFGNIDTDTDRRVA